MPYYVFQSAHLDELIQQKLDLLIPTSLFDESTLLIVQNQQTADYLRHSLAQKASIIMGFSYKLTEQAFRHLALGFNCVRQAVQYNEHTQSAACPFLFDDDLQLLLYQTLQQHHMYSNLHFITDYVHKIPSQSKETRLWDLAHKIAQWFAQYARSSAPLMHSWRENQFLASMPESEQTWQKFLWFTLFGTAHPAYNILGDWLDRVMMTQAPYLGETRRIILLGSAFLNEVYLDFLQYLSHQGCDVFHIMLSPIQNAHVGTNLPFLLNHAEMFRQLYSFFQQHPDTCVHYTPLAMPKQQNMLSVLQYCLHYGRPWKDKIAPDHSIRFVACSDEEREVEVLKDLLLHKLDTDDQLNLNEIAILAPDINKYATYIQAIFAQGSDAEKLPCNIIDLNTPADPAFVQAVSGLLNLSGTSFTRKGILDLLSNPLLMQRYEIDTEEKEIWAKFCEETAILRHKNQEQKRKLNLGNSAVNTFDNGFYRFIIGQTIGETDTPCGQSLMGLPKSTATKIRKFFVIVNKLYDDFSSLDQKKLPLPAWLDLIEKKLSDHLAGPGKDPLSLRMVFSHLRESCSKTASLPYAQNALSFFVVKQIITEVIEKQKLRIGRYLSNGIVCSSLMPLRAIPFKIIVILGLNNGEFPQISRSKNQNYDLLQSSGLQQKLHIKGEKHHLDRYAFLETIFSTHQELWLFHQDRDTFSGERLSSSSSLADLEIFLSQMLTTKEQLALSTLIFPKSPYSPKLFTPQAQKNVPCYASKYLGLAKTRALIHTTSQMSATPQISCKEESWEKVWQETIMVKNLVDFVNDPVDFHIKKVLHVDQSRSNKTEDKDRTDETYALSPWEQDAFYQEFLTFCLTNEEFSKQNADILTYRFLENSRRQKLKTGEISSALLSDFYYLSIQEAMLHLSQSLLENGLYRFIGPCVFNDKKDAPEFLAPARYTIHNQQGYIYGTMPNLYLDPKTQTLHYFRLLYQNNSYKKRAPDNLPADLLAFLLCFDSAPKLRIKGHIFHMQEKSMAQFYQTMEYIGPIEDTHKAISSVAKAFLMCKQEAPCFSIYPSEMPQNLCLDYTKYKDCQERFALKLKKFSRVHSYPYEEEVLREFYNKIHNISTKKVGKKYEKQKT